MIVSPRALLGIAKDFVGADDSPGISAPLRDRSGFADQGGPPFDGICGNGAPQTFGVIVWEGAPEQIV